MSFPLHQDCDGRVSHAEIASQLQERMSLSSMLYSNIHDTPAQNNIACSSSKNHNNTNNESRCSSSYLSKSAPSSLQYNADCEDASNSSSDLDDFSDDADSGTYYSSSTYVSSEDYSQCSSFAESGGNNNKSQHEQLLSRAAQQQHHTNSGSSSSNNLIVSSLSSPSSSGRKQQHSHLNYKNLHTHNNNNNNNNNMNNQDSLLFRRSNRPTIRERSRSSQSSLSRSNDNCNNSGSNHDNNNISNTSSRREDISYRNYTVSFKKSKTRIPSSSNIHNNSNTTNPERSFRKNIHRTQQKNPPPPASLLAHNYQQHQARLKRNYIEAFTFHDKKQRMQSDHTTTSTTNKKPCPNKEQEEDSKPKAKTPTHETALLSIGPDTMAQILSFLTPVESHTLLTMPVSKRWRETFTFPQDIWKILCLSDPFFIKIDHSKKSRGGNATTTTTTESLSSEASFSSFPSVRLPELSLKHMFGRYRLLYTSFVKCVRYLDQIKSDALQGRTPRGLEPVQLPAATGVAARFDDSGGGADTGSNVKGGECLSITTKTDTPQKQSSPKGKEQGQDTVEKTRFSHSKLTERLLGPTLQSRNPGPVDLPWSCAIYSVVNWMVAFIDVLGIQIMCLEVLPCLLEDESQRTIGQRAGLTDIVLKGMVIFPDSVELHTAAFHTLVLLARPLGGKEGMLFHRTMVGDNTTNINRNSSSNTTASSSPNNANTCKNGIAVMLDSMRRFRSDESLQAMSSWSMVNIALISSQKTMLVKLDGISVVANGMIQHPFSSEVQFRALFALINLVIPCEQTASSSSATVSTEESSEKEILDECVGQIANLVVVAMKNFCSSEAIMNRACLVLHNLSLNDEYHRTLLWTPNCYQMLEWAMGNYRFDQVLQQSAGGTLQRLQRTLRGDRDLHIRFSASIRANQQQQRPQQVAAGSGANNNN